MATENYLLSIQGNVSGSYNEVVMCFQSAGLASNDTLSAGANLIQAWLANAEAKWLACLPPSYFVNNYSARRAFPKPSAVANFQYQAFAKPGTRGIAAGGYNLCPCVHLIPPMGTKSVGKVFMPAVAAGDIVNNQYIAGYTTVINTLFSQLATTGLAGSGTLWHLGIFSRKNISVSLVTAFGQSEAIGFQGRRRKPAGVS